MYVLYFIFTEFVTVSFSSSKYFINERDDSVPVILVLNQSLSSNITINVTVSYKESDAESSEYHFILIIVTISLLKVKSVTQHFQLR